MRFYFAFIFAIFNLNSYAQSIKGQTIDSDTKQGVPNVNVFIEDTLRATSDENGYFSVKNLGIGRYSIKFSSTGYESNLISEVLIGSGKEIILSVPLTEKIKLLNEIIVSSKKTNDNSVSTVSSHSFTVEQMKRYPAAWDDPARMALSFAGTTNSDDQNNNIIIRGNSPKGMLWKMEGVEIPNPNHFSQQGASGGAVSGLSANVLSNSDFYTSAFTPEYGNATSGVFDLKMRNGNKDKSETVVQAGFIGLEASTKGPFTKNSKASYLVNYRYSTLGIITGLGLLKIDANLNYQDVAFKINVPLKKSVLSLWGIGGIDKASSAQKKNGFYASGLNWLYFINHKSFWENIVSASGTVISQYDASIPSSNSDYVFQHNQLFKSNSLRFASTYNLKIDSKNSLKIGSILSVLNFNDIDTTYIYQNHLANHYVNIKQKNYTELFQSFAQWKGRFNEHLSLVAGVHYMQFVFNKTKSFEPRAMFKWKLNSFNSINLGFGVHSKIEDITTYMLNVNVNNVSTQFNKTLPIPKSQHLVLGYTYFPNSQWRINIETYIQQQSKIGVASVFYSQEQNLGSYSMLNNIDGVSYVGLQGTGTGINKGVELTAERFLIKGFYLLNTTSIYKATFKGNDGIERGSRFNSNFVENFLVGREWKINKKIFMTNLKLTWTGGNRVTPINIAESVKQGYQVIDYSHAFEQKLSDYFKADIGLRYIINKKKLSQRISLDLNNVTNHKNELYQYFNAYYYTNNLKLLTQYQLTFLPILSYRVEF